MSVPPYIVGAFFTLLVPYLSSKTGRRALFMASLFGILLRLQADLPFAQTLSSPFMIVGFAMFLGTTQPRVRYGATFLIAIGAFSFGAMCNAWAAANTTSDTARGASIATVVLAGNCGGLISTWSYQAKYAPNQIPVRVMMVRSGP